MAGWPRIAGIPLISRICRLDFAPACKNGKPPAAGRSRPPSSLRFISLFPGRSFVALHFDDFRCGNKLVHCDTTGCLHEVYVATNGRYRRVLAVHARDIRLITYQNTAAVEISGGVNSKTRTLRWNGSRFVE